MLSSCHASVFLKIPFPFILNLVYFSELSLLLYKSFASVIHFLEAASLFLKNEPLDVCKMGCVLSS